MGNKIYDIIVIGAGSAGISCVVEAKLNNMDNILLIEKSTNHLDTIRKFYKDGKRVDKDWKSKHIELKGNINFDDGTKESTILYFENLLKNNNISPLYNTEVEKVIKNQETNLFDVYTLKNIYKAKYVVICIGKMGKPKKPDYKLPVNKKNYINFNLDDCTTNENILVIGGGNSAIEYACYLLDSKNKVSLAYRKQKFTRLNKINEKIINQYVKDNKINLQFNKDIKGILNDDDNKKVSVIFDDNSIEIYDRLVYAIGGTTPINFLKACDVNIDCESSHPTCNEYHESNVKNLYLAGDIIAYGDGSICLSLNHGYEIIQDIIKKNV